MPTSPPPALPIRVESRGDTYVLVDANGDDLPEGSFDDQGAAQAAADRVNQAWSSLDADAKAALKVKEHAVEEVPSQVYPGLERKPGKQNWVDYAGGLPSYIERIAKHIHYEGGRPIGTAIAMAVSTVKRWCAGGVVSKTGPHVSNVNADTKAKACRAVAEWEAKRARGRVSKAARHAVESEEVDVTLEEAASFISAVEGQALVLPAVDPDDLHVRLDEAVRLHRRLVTAGADPKQILLQREIVRALRERIEEATTKKRVRKDGSPVESGRTGE